MDVFDVDTLFRSHLSNTRIKNRVFSDLQLILLHERFNFRMVKRRKQLLFVESYHLIAIAHFDEVVEIGHEGFYSYHSPGRILKFLFADLGEKILVQGKIFIFVNHDPECLG